MEIKKYGKATLVQKLSKLFSKRSGYVPHWTYSQQYQKELSVRFGE